MNSPEANTTNTNVNGALYGTVFAAVHKVMPPWIAYLGVRHAIGEAISGTVADAGRDDPNHPEIQDFLIGVGADGWVGSDPLT